jgi:aminoglycoside 3-N-acetyltransferase
LLVHSSYDAFANFEGNANDVLDVLLDLVGPEGTLVMPSQPAQSVSKFDSRRSPASTGMLCELFRRTDGTLRSLHPGQSVCARGPYARELTREHHLDELGCGRLSPYAKLVHFDSQILGLGLPPLYTTFLHVVEDLDLENYPRQIYSRDRRVCRVIDAEGNELSIELFRRDDKVLSAMNLNRMAKHLSPEAHSAFDVHGVPCFVCHPFAMLAELKELAKNGILLYG